MTPDAPRPDTITPCWAPSVTALDPEWDALFAAGDGVQCTRMWFESLEEAAMPPGTCPAWLGLRHGGRPVALLPLALGPGQAAVSLTGLYTTAFQPLLRPNLPPERLGEAFGQALRTRPVTRLEALDPHWPALAPLLQGLHRAGLRTARFDHFGNWTESVAGLDHATWFARRPGALRETIRRRTRAADRAGNVRFTLHRATDRLDTAIAAYEAVYARSWKTPEPHPRFNATLLPRLATQGVLRLFVMWQGDQPIAAQYWTVANGHAAVLKLAHDDTARALSPGTLLTAFAIHTLFEEGGLAQLDFGRGDDPYKKDWVSERRQRIGVLLINPWRPAGLATLLRHRAGTLLRTVRNRAGPVAPG